MATYRIGIGSEFQLKDNAVGVGSETTGLGNLIIDGTLKASSGLSASGVSTFINYSGFTPDEISGDVTLTGEHLTTGDIVVGVGETFIVSAGATVDVGSVESVSIGTHFSLPIGNTEDRPEVPVEGTVRFNKDLNTLEFYNGFEWRQFTVSGARGRGIYCGGTTTGSNHISSNEFIEIATQGNAQNFGDLSVSRDGSSRGTTSSAIRGLSMAGYISPAASDVIDYLTIASEGNSIDFGNAFQARGWGAGMSSSTRGISAGGYNSGGVNTIDYVEIMTTGNAVDFGDLPTVKESTVGMASPTRGIIGTGMLGGTTTTTTEYLTIASKGNAVVFGDADAIRGLGAAANTTRGLFAGGKGPDQQNLNLIYKITIASTGSQTEFGTLATGARKPDGVSNSTRACFAGGENAPGGRITAIQSVNFSSGGNTEFFGDLAVARQAGNCNSDSHGGLGGY